MMPKDFVWAAFNVLPWASRQPDSPSPPQNPQMSSACLPPATRWKPYSLPLKTLLAATTTWQFPAVAPVCLVLALLPLLKKRPHQKRNLLPSPSSPISRINQTTDLLAASPRQPQTIQQSRISFVFAQTAIDLPLLLPRRAATRDAASSCFRPTAKLFPRAQTKPNLCSHNCLFYSPRLFASFLVLFSVKLSLSLHTFAVVVLPFSLFHLLLSICLLVATPAV